MTFFSFLYFSALVSLVAGCISRVPVILEESADSPPSIDTDPYALAPCVFTAMHNVKSVIGGPCSSIQVTVPNFVAVFNLFLQFDQVNVDVTITEIGNGFVQALISGNSTQGKVRHLVYNSIATTQSAYDFVKLEAASITINAQHQYVASFLSISVSGNVNFGTGVTNGQAVHFFNCSIGNRIDAPAGCGFVSLHNSQVNQLSSHGNNEILIVSTQIYDVLVLGLQNGSSSNIVHIGPNSIVDHVDAYGDSSQFIHVAGIVDKNIKFLADTRVGVANHYVTIADDGIVGNPAYCNGINHFDCGVMHSTNVAVHIVMSREPGESATIIRPYLHRFQPKKERDTMCFLQGELSFLVQTPSEANFLNVPADLYVIGQQFHLPRSRASICSFQDANCNDIFEVSATHGF